MKCKLGPRALECGVYSRRSLPRPHSQRVSPERLSHEPHQGQFHPLKYPGKKDLRVPSSCSKHTGTGLSLFHSQDVHLWCPPSGQKPGQVTKARREGRAQWRTAWSPGVPPQALLTPWAITDHRGRVQASVSQACKSMQRSRLLSFRPVLPPHLP